MEFIGVNSSFFPYEVALEFQLTQNLQSYGSTYRATLLPGSTRIASMKILDTNLPHNYSYQIRYTLGIKNAKADARFPYLFPVAKGKTIQQSFGLLRLTEGDTIFAMRKGIVTCLPDERPSDRLMKNSVEVYHADGTLAVYQGLAPDNLFVVYGQRVYPGQPIGILENPGAIVARVFNFQGEGKYGTFNFQYALDDTQTAPSSSFQTATVDHPLSVITRELSKSELKKLNKGKLYHRPETEAD